VSSDYGPGTQEIGINFSAPLESHSRVLRKGWSIVSSVQATCITPTFIHYIVPILLQMTAIEEVTVR